MAGLGSPLTSLNTLAGGLSSDAIPIIDTHMHLWDLQKLRYSWLENQGPPLEQNFLVEDYQEATQDCLVKKAVFVECGVASEQYLEEVDWVVGLAQHMPQLQGIVAQAPLEEGPRVAPKLEKLVTRPLVKGIRRGVNKELIRDPQFVAGLRLLPKYQLSFDLITSPTLLPEAAALVRQCPQTIFVLDHLGNPNIKENVLGPWKMSLNALAQRPNVYCKLSGIITKADLKHWTPDDLRPYVLHALEAFGADRVLFGGRLAGGVARGKLPGVACCAAKTH